MICSYCDSECKATREHVVPSWYIQTPGDSEVFSARAPLTHVKGDLVVKDVCTSCNNGPLADLDAYGKQLYQNFFAEPVYADESVAFECDGSRLLRWLLKLSYNSARAQNTDVRLFHGYRRAILGEAPFPDLKCWLHVVTPSYIDEMQQIVRPAQRREQYAENLDKPLWFRIGQFRLPSHPALFLTQRIVMINSFAFVFLIPNRGTQQCDTNVEQWSKAFTDGYPQARSISIGSNRFVIRPGSDHTSLHRYGMLVSYPSRYSDNGNAITSEILKGKDGEVSVIMLEVDRDWIQACDTSTIAASLQKMVSTREDATAYRQRITVMVTGFSDDARELWQIGEAKSFFRKLFSECPFVMFLAHPPRKGNG
jgi:hypothetical protein